MPIPYPVRQQGIYTGNQQGCPAPTIPETHPAPSPSPLSPHPQGIKKLRALHAGDGQRVLWRGMRSVKVTEGFMKHVRAYVRTRARARQQANVSMPVVQYIAPTPWSVQWPQKQTATLGRAAPN